MGDYEENTTNENDVIEIRGEPKYYSTGQVAKMLEEADSTIRYWSDEFEDFLKIRKTGASGRVRRFTMTDIKKIEYIRNLLKDENLSIQQVKEYLSSPEANELKPISKEREQIMVEAIAKVMSTQIEEVFDRRFQELEELLLKTTKIQADAHRDLIKDVREEIQTEKNSIINKLNDNYEAISETIVKVEEDSKKKEEDLKESIHDLKESLNTREEKLDKYIADMRNEKSETEKRGFFSRIFKK